MNVLDENISESQRQLLRSWRISASFIRRLLRHPAFKTQAKRMGKVIRVGHGGIRLWRLHVEEEEQEAW